MAKKTATRKKNARRIKRTPPSEAGEATCFVIMPFGGWFDTYYDLIFEPAIKNAKLLPRRADDIYRPGTIVHDIWDLTLDADVLLADLTGKNANVLYELGLAHAACKPVVIITESIEDVPFDLRALRIIEYDKNNPNWGTALKKAIQSSLQELVSNPLKSIPPVFLARHPDFSKIPKNHGAQSTSQAESHPRPASAGADTGYKPLSEEPWATRARNPSLLEIERTIESYLLSGMPVDLIIARIVSEFPINRSRVERIVQSMKRRIR